MAPILEELHKESAGRLEQVCSLCDGDVGSCGVMRPADYGGGRRSTIFSISATGSGLAR